MTQSPPIQRGAQSGEFSSEISEIFVAIGKQAMASPRPGFK